MKIRNLLPKPYTDMEVSQWRFYDYDNDNIKSNKLQRF
jgi:hypothetical protein